MKVVELLKLSGEVLKLMSKNDIMRDDYRYVSLYEQYQTMRSNKMKHHASVAMLSEEYKISIRTVERIISRLRRDC